MNENEEKVLFQSEISHKRNFFILGLVLFGVGFIALLIDIIVSQTSFWGGFGGIFLYPHDGGMGYLILFLFALAAFVAGIVLLCLSVDMKGVLTITDKRVDFKVTVQRIKFLKGHDYEVFIPNSTIKVVEASKHGNVVVVKGERETIRFCYVEGVLDVLAKVLP